ncbi:MAG TPA: RecQ family ATP-dependent DNA helicase, partial [Solirubrobacteraceae bacterium]
IPAQEHLRRRPLGLTLRKQWPATLDGGARKIPDQLRLSDGRALARAGDGGWDPLIREGRFESGRFDDALVDACVELLSGWRPEPAPRWIAAVPSRRQPDLVPDFARRLAAAVSLPFCGLLNRVGDGPPQREMRNSAQQAANVRGEFEVVGVPPPGPGLLVDDLWYSGWTLTTLGALLREAGSGPIHALVLALAGA